jgi:hypothetical protein
MASGDDGRQS